MGRRRGLGPPRARDGRSEWALGDHVPGSLWPFIMSAGRSTVACRPSTLLRTKLLVFQYVQHPLYVESKKK